MQKWEMNDEGAEIEDFKRAYSKSFHLSSS